MADMKKHQFLQVELASTVRLSPADKLKMKRYLALASLALEKSFSDKEFIKAGKDITQLQVSLLICGDKRIQELNGEYRNKDYVTDVLSFPAHEDLRQLRKLPMMSRNLFLGDMAICHPQTKRQAKEFEISYWDEFIHLFIHGVLHLLGYDHEESVKEQKLQELWEDRLLSEISRLKKK